MKRQVILKGASTVLAGDVTSAQPSAQLWQIWNNETPLYTDWAGCSTGSPHYWAVGFERPPTLALFNKVTITANFDYSQNGPNNWYFPPTVSHGPKAGIILRKRGKSGGTYVADDWIAGTGDAIHELGGHTDPAPCPAGAVACYAYHNTNRSTHPTQIQCHPLSWELLSHPEGGPWTFEDLTGLAVGIVVTTANGPGGKPFYVDRRNSSFWIRVATLTVTLDVEDLGAFVRNVRTTASIALRMMRRARNVLRPVTFIDNSPGLLGDRIYMSHPRGPDYGKTGWGARRLERRAGIILAREYDPEQFKVEDEVYDLRAFSCLGWGVYRIDVPWNPELQGVALIDKGSGWTHDRGQDAWSPRPGDGVVNRVLEDYPNVSFHGLAVQGGGDVSVCLRNYDLTQSGWSTVGSAGSFTAASDTAVHMAEEQGYLSSCRLTYGPSGGTGGQERSLGALTEGRLHVRVLIKNTNVPTPATQFGEWYLKRGVYYWDNTNRTWIASPTYNPIPSDTPAGEAIGDSITAVAGTYYIGVGRFSSQMGPVTLHAALVDVQHTDTTVAGARTPLVTLDATITREPDIHRMPHVWGRELWDHDRGTAIIEVQPFWRAADLPDATVKPLLHAQHDSSTTWDAIQFLRNSAGWDKIRFRRAISGESSYSLECDMGESVGVSLDRSMVLRAWARWLGADGWGQFAPYSVQVGFAVFNATTKALIYTRSTLGTLSSTTRVPHARTYLGIGCDETRFLDGYVRMWETRRNPLHELEAIWRV